MKRFYKTLPLALALSVGSLYAQTEETPASQGQMMEETNKPANSKDNGKPNIKSNSSLFQPKKKSWSFAIHGGLPVVQGDVSFKSGLGYGFEVRKALGHTFTIRLNANNGSATGANWKRNNFESLKRNAGVNGKNNPAANYYSANSPLYANYKLNFTHVTIDALFNFNNINFLNESPRFGLYAIAGAGALLSETWIDQLDASGNRYDYSEENVPRASGASDKKKTFDKLNQMRDGNYETKADGNNHDKSPLKRKLDYVANMGVGFNYRINKRLGLYVEGTYMYTGNDLLDGQRWYSADDLTKSADGLVNINLGLNIRLGRTDNIDWNTNPLALPYKTIMENKKKLAKVDKLEKDVDDVNKRLDTLNNDVASLKADADGDGVSDFHDKEDSTLAGAVVNGAGETILFKNKDGDLVYNDPNIARKNQGIKNGTLNEDGTYKSDAGVELNADGTPKKKTKVRFDANDPEGKTVFMKGNGSNTYNSPGTSSSYGYLPAVFFESNNTVISQNAYPQLYEVARILKQNPNIKITVIGHADSRNTESYNKQLGLNRANAVSKMLVKNFGVNESQLILESRGEVEPLSNTKNMNALAANRRVQFEISNGKSSPIKANTTKPQSKKEVKITKPQPKKAEVKVEENINTPAPGETEVQSNKIIEEPKTAPADTTNSGEVFTPESDF